MKVVHVIKRLEAIDNDIKELRKLEKSISRDKSFTTPIFMTIEKQVNILLGERVNLLDLQIANPPKTFVPADEGDEEVQVSPIHTIPEPKKTVKKAKAKEAEEVKPAPVKKKIILPDDDDIPMLTQDMVDAKFDSLKNEVKTKSPAEDVLMKSPEPETPLDDTSIKLLDVALEKGSLNRKVMDKEKKVRFFRENFPSD